MQLSNKIILLISPEPWDHIFVSKHHYATHLAARGNIVYFLNPPSGKSLHIHATKYPKIFTIDYNGFLKGLRFLPDFVMRYYIRKKYNALQMFCKVEFDIVWSFDNSVFYNFSALPKSVLKISHIVDLNQDFQTEKAAKTADICFGTTHFIVDRMKKYNPNSNFITHGFNIPTSSNDNIILPGNNRIKVMYAGNLGISYIDWDTINQVIIDNSKIDFLFAGKMNGIQKIFGHKNVFYLGVIKSDQLPYYYKKIDLLWICYKAEEYEKQLANPHKMMEYLGSGKTVVATKTLEYQKIANDGLIAMSDKNEEFLQLFKVAVSDLTLWNSEEKLKKRMAYAFDNTYKKQIKRIELLLEKHV